MFEHISQVAVGQSHEKLVNKTNINKHVDYQLGTTGIGHCKGFVEFNDKL